MPKSAKPRKKKRKLVDPLAHWRLKTSISDSGKTDLLLYAYQCLDMLKKGKGAINECGVLNCALSAARCLCLQEFGKEYIHMVDAAIGAVERAYTRGKETGRFGLDGEGMSQIAEGLEVYKEQLDFVTVGTLKKTYLMLDESYKSATRGEVC